MKNFDDSILTDLVHVRFASQIGQGRNHRMRNGLAPVEMAIALPFLMLFMAAIIAFGYAASWKIRSEVVARDVGWRSRGALHDLRDPGQNGFAGMCIRG